MCTFHSAITSYHLELISALLVAMKSQTTSLGRMGWVAGAKSQKKVNPGRGIRFFLPPFSQCERRARSVPDARPQWESGRGGHNYSGALALYTAATRGVLRTAASGLDVRMTSADSALSRYPSRRTDQFFPKPRGEGVRPTATLIAIHL